MVVNNKEVKYN